MKIYLEDQYEELLSQIATLENKKYRICDDYEYSKDRVRYGALLQEKRCLELSMGVMRKYTKSS